MSCEDYKEIDMLLGGDRKIAIGAHRQKMEGQD